MTKGKETPTQDTLTQVMEILDNHCHGGYGYLKQVNKKTQKVTKYFSKRYTKCSELGKNYSESICSQCPYGKKLLSLGQNMSTPEELEEDKKITESMKPRWTEEEDIFLSHLINNGKLPKNIYTIYKEKFLSNRPYSAVYRRIQTLNSNESGLVARDNVLWLKKDTQNLEKFLESNRPVTSFPRGRFPLRTVYKKMEEIKQNKQNENKGELKQ